MGTQDFKPVLSLFPGVGLLDYAFEREGFNIFRGPDILWGGDIKRWHCGPGFFHGLIGGPPCQKYSTGSQIAGTNALDLIPEFVRVYHETKPRWVVMENVRGALKSPDIPKEWIAVELRDFDCGGETARKRYFWVWPFWCLSPDKRPGKPSHSVMASTYKRGKSTSGYVRDKGFLPGDLPLEEYARLQGAEEIGQRLIENNCPRQFAVHLLGNGVPVPMGRYIAQVIKQQVYHEAENGKGN